MVRIWKYLIISTLIIVLLFLLYLSAFYILNRDIENVEIKGYVLDSKTNNPVENVIVLIENDRFESDSGIKTMMNI